MRLVRDDHVDLENIYRRQGVVTGQQGRLTAQHVLHWQERVIVGDESTILNPRTLGQPSPCLCSVFENTVAQHWPSLPFAAQTYPLTVLGFTTH